MEEYLRDQLRSARSPAARRSRDLPVPRRGGPGAARAGDDRQGLGPRAARAPRPSGAVYDLVIVDAPATGHGLGDAAHAAHLRGRRAGRADPPPGAIIDEFLRDAGDDRAWSRSRCPEEMPVNETIELERRLDDEMGMELDAVVVNAVLPERFTARGGAPARRRSTAAGRPRRAPRCGGAVGARAARAASARRPPACGAPRTPRCSRCRSCSSPSSASRSSSASRAILERRL